MTRYHGSCHAILSCVQFSSSMYCILHASVLEQDHCGHEVPLLPGSSEYSNTPQLASFTKAALSLCDQTAFCRKQSGKSKTCASPYALQGHSPQYTDRISSLSSFSHKVDRDAPASTMNRAMGTLTSIHFC